MGRAMLDRRQSSVRWIDFLWLPFLLGLAFLPAIDQIHKQLILLAIVVFQFLEGPIIARFPTRGPTYSVIIKLLLATLLLDHTGDLGINSPYYPIYFLPVITSAIYFSPFVNLVWCTLASLAYCSFLAEVLPEYELTAEAITYLAIRIVFFYFVAVVVNQFAVENRRQVKKYQSLSETLEETNLQLQRAEAGARRSERLAALGQMSAGLAHEIRNPLGVIKGSAEMLTKKLKDSQPLESELAGYISSEVNRLNSLVARFLDFARPQHLELHPQEISRIVERSLSSVQNQLPASHVIVERQYAENLPQILVDEQFCERIFVNLILNAFQAMDDPAPSDPAVLRLAIAPESWSGKPGVAVTIEDSGPGVPPALREQIFNPFFTSKKDGVGLGLSIVAKIVDDHRGWIRLENEPGHGARFRVFLPLSPAA
jgi:two-component system sensor histidine kinase HydH